MDTSAPLAAIAMKWITGIAKHVESVRVIMVSISFHLMGNLFASCLATIAFVYREDFSFLFSFNLSRVMRERERERERERDMNVAILFLCMKMLI